jgi:hypothetical protein
MEEEFVTYEQALALNELGFKLHRNIAMYDVNKNLVVYGVICYDDISAPLKQQVFRWFREKYKLEGLVERSKFSYKFAIYYYLSNSKGYVDYEIEKDTYEEAENACIDKLIEITKQQDNGK